MDRTCTGCGSPIARTGKRGRPRIWCSDACYWSHYTPPRTYPPSVKRFGRSCEDCGKDIDHRHGSAFLCERCGKIRRGSLVEPIESRKCAVCSGSFSPTNWTAKYCSAECRNRRTRPRPNRKRRYTDADRVRDQRKAAVRRGASTGRPVVMCEIGDRDGWHCELCEKPVNRWLEYPDPKSPSLDHIVPLSLGGAHDPSNARVTHLDCNVKRGNRVEGEQLPLEGLLAVL